MTVLQQEAPYSEFGIGVSLLIYHIYTNHIAPNTISQNPITDPDHIHELGK